MLARMNADMVPQVLLGRDGPDTDRGTMSIRELFGLKKTRRVLIGVSVREIRPGVFKTKAVYA